MGKKSLGKGKKEGNNPVLEAAVLGWIARRQFKKTLHSAELRMKVVKEIIETERSYLQGVESIVVDYLEPIRTTFPPLIPAESISIIFGKIEDIFLINKELYEQLTSSTPEKAGKKIGDIFLKTAPYLKLYSEYCKNHPIAIAQLQKRMEEEKFAYFIKKIRLANNVLDLPSLLIMPVQRIPRYKLLLIELLKRTHPAEPDFTDLNVALSKVSEVADHINNGIKERQNLEKLLSIQKQLTGTVPPIVIPRRVFLREGSLMKVCRKVNKRRHFILFNDAFIYGSPMDATGKFKFHRILNLYNGKVKDVSDKAKIKNAFQIICKEKSFTVFGDTPEEKKSWFSSFENAFYNINHEPQVAARFSKHYSTTNVISASINTSQSKLPVGDEESAPVWVPDSDAERCMACASKFTAFRRRHHCRKCGKVVCGKCSNYSYKLDNLNRTARVCTFCFKELTQTSPNSVATLPSSDSFDNLSEFLSNLNDNPSARQENKGGLVTVTVRRINAPEKGLHMVRGKVLLPQTHKSQRRMMYSNVANGVEQHGNGTGVDTPLTSDTTTVADSPLALLPPLPALPQGTRPRMSAFASSVALLPPNGQAGAPTPSPLLHPLKAANINNNSNTSLDEWKIDRRVSSDSTDTSQSNEQQTDDMSAASSREPIEDLRHSPRVQARPMVVGN